MKLLLILFTSIILSTNVYASDWECITELNQEFRIVKDTEFKNRQKVIRYLGWWKWTDVLVVDAADVIIINEKATDHSYSYRCARINNVNPFFQNKPENKKENNNP